MHPINTLRMNTSELEAESRNIRPKNPGKRLEGGQEFYEGEAAIGTSSRYSLQPVRTLPLRIL